MIKGAVKAGKLANGLELGKGKIVHAIKTDKESLYLETSLCGQKPKVQWSERQVSEVNCHACLIKVALDDSL